jgi:hypothetical protein
LWASWRLERAKGSGTTGIGLSTLCSGAGNPTVLSLSPQANRSFSSPLRTTAIPLAAASIQYVVGNSVLSTGKSIYQWFNAAAFAQPANFTSGDLSRTYTGVRTDMLKNIDFSPFKNFGLTERFKLQFRAEAFNLTNTPVFSAPGTMVNGVNFGVVTGQSNVPRNLQLALKLLF